MLKYCTIVLWMICLSCGSSDDAKNGTMDKPVDPADSAMQATHQESSSGFPIPPENGTSTDSSDRKDSLRKDTTRKH